MASYPSFREQSAHYFNRPHDAVPEGPVSATGAAWRGDEFLGNDSWRHPLSSAEIVEIEAAIQTAIMAGRQTGELRREDFPLPNLGTRIADWREELDRGRGFVLVTGLPLDRWPDSHTELFFWCFGLHLGRPGGQNPAGDLLGHVCDTGAREQDEFVRLYQTSANIAYHCDAADVVGLLCKNKARSGGLSRIVSSVCIYNELASRRPDLAARLFDPMLLDVRDAKADDAFRFFPVPPCRYADGRLRTFYHSDYFRSVQRHEDAPRFTDLERELLDEYEEIATTPGLYLDMDLEPGDIQLVSNHTVLHARTEYREWPEPERKRHLLRLWLSLDR
jgi:hypothetical protein